MISLDDAAVSVPSHRPDHPDAVLLRPIRLKLTERRIAVIGPNGSGKSTLLRLLNGLRRPSTGTVTVEGLDTVSQARQVRSKVGFLFTDPLSQLVMPIVVEDVELSLKASIRDRKKRHAAALRALDAMGIAHLADRSVYDISGGERQLVALASVLAAGQEILVADEPTTLLDLRNNDLLQSVLFGLPQQVLYATHDLEFAARAERVLVVNDASVVFDGPAQEAVAQYRQLALAPGTR